MDDSRIDLYSPVVEVQGHDDQDVLLTGARARSGGSPGRTIAWKRIAKVSGVLILVACLGGVIGAVCFPRNLTPVIFPNTTTTTTQTPTAPTTMPTTTTEKPTTTSTSTTTTKTTTSTTKRPTTTHNPLPPGPFPPPTKNPLPPHPETVPPVSLLYMMDMSPTFVLFPCEPTKPEVWFWNVTVADHTFASQGGDGKQEAKTNTAMVANEAIFGFKYPHPIPVPHSKCVIVGAGMEEKEE